MSKWLLRGLVFAALMVIVRLLQGALINAMEQRAATISIIGVVAYALCALLWGYIDGRADAKAHPDPDRRSDLAMIWLLTGVFAGVVSGLVMSIIGMFYDAVYIGNIITEVTTTAAFTALLTFLLALLGVAIGRWLVDRKRPDQPRQREDDDRADTDVFAAVRADGSQDDGAQQTTPVATGGGGTERAPENRA